MANLIISDTLAERLQRFAERQNKPVEAVLESMLERFEPEVSENTEENTTLKFNKYNEIWSPQATEKGIAALYRAIEDNH